MTNDDSLAQLHALLRQVFSTDVAVDEWLDTPDRSLEWQTPRALANQPGGMRRVRGLVARVIHGVQ